MRQANPQATRPAVPTQNVHNVVLGDIAFRTWYPSFYPEAIVGKDIDRLYVCGWCLAYTNDLSAYLIHLKTCNHKNDPLGRLIYKQGNSAVYEIDGEEEKLFAQNLSLFAKLFLDNKSVFFDVVGFRYYLLVSSTPAVVTSTPKVTLSEQRIVGFFSKEKLSWDLNNLACILVFPPWQRKGLGKILMGISYELSRREHRIGGPEKPLSELGRKSYLAFWQARVANEVLSLKNRANVDVAELAARCSMVVDDVVTALREMEVCEMKKKGDINVSKARIREWVSKTRVDLAPPVDEALLVDQWVPDDELPNL